MEYELLYLLYFKDARASSCPCLLEDAAWGSCWPSWFPPDRNSQAKFFISTPEDTTPDRAAVAGRRERLPH